MTNEPTSEYTRLLLRATTAKLDALAASVGAYFGIDLGEHTPDNDPWQNAQDAIDTALRERAR